VSQVNDNVSALKNPKFSADELRQVDDILAGKHLA